MVSKRFCDILRWSLIIAATAFGVKWLWAFHWLLGLTLSVPAFILFMNVVGFLTLPLYAITIEGWEAQKDLAKLCEKQHEFSKSQQCQDKKE